MAKHQRDPEKERFWREVFSEHRVSGLNGRDFCRQQGLSESSFYAWRKELRRRDDEPVATPRTTGSARQRKTKRAGDQSTANTSAKQQVAAASLVEVMTRAMPTTPVIEIDTPSGFTLRLSPPVDRETLAMLLDLLTAEASRAC